MRRILSEEYATGRKGLPGDDDAGTMSSWYVWSVMGLYPNASQPYYYVGSPIFSRVSIDLGGGESFTVYAPDTSDRNLYVAGAWLGGIPLERAWIMHSELAGGGTLLLEMSPEPVDWATAERPPSVSSVR